MLGDIGKQYFNARSLEPRDRLHQYLMVSFLFLVFAIVLIVFALNIGEQQGTDCFGLVALGVGVIVSMWISIAVLITDMSAIITP